MIPRGPKRVRRPILTALAALSAIACAPEGTVAQVVPGTGDPDADTVTLGRATIDALRFEPLVFEQPEVSSRSIDDVDVLVLADHTLPIVNAYAYFRGGYGLFGRESYAAAMGLPALLRYGGTEGRSPAEVDESLDYHALLLSFGSGGGSVTTSVNALTDQLAPALDLWGEMIARPRFDPNEVAAWRGRQLEAVRRRVDNPALLAFSELNRLLYGDHPIGWEMDESDLAPDRLTPERFHDVHRRVVCRGNLVLGLTGDVDWSVAEPLMRRLIARIPACDDDLPEAPLPDIRRAPGVFVVEKALDQAVIVMAHPTSVRQDDDGAYYAAVIGNSILGGGGFSSRLVGRIRTEEGFAYSAASLWTTPRKHEGIIGATTRTRPERVVPATEAILETMAELRVSPPSDDEVRTTVDQIVNGFVFNFDTPGQIVARSMAFQAQELPDDWLERYWRGVQEVTPADVQAVFAENLEPEAMTILIVGDPSRMALDQLEGLGPVIVIEVR